MSDKALLCGINEYQSISELNGCLNDLESMQELLLQSFSFDSQNVRILKNSEVTKSAIVDGFEWLAERADANDRIVFHFSGHGSFTRSKTPGKQIDEIICLYDMDWRDEDSFLRDIDLGELTKRIGSGARLTVILDSCFSGTGTRAFKSNFSGLVDKPTSQSKMVIVADTADLISMQASPSNKPRGNRGVEETDLSFLDALKSNQSLPVYARFVTPPATIGKLIASDLEVQAFGESLKSSLNHQLLAAASDKQPAADAFIDGKYQGVFSHSLCKTAEANLSKPVSEIMKMTSDHIKKLGFSQDPQTEGPFGKEAIFGSTTTATQLPTANAQSVTPVANSLQLEATMSSNFDPLDALDRLLRVSEKLIEMSASRKPQPTPVRFAGQEKVAVRDFLVDTNILNLPDTKPKTRDVFGIDDRARVGNTLDQPFCWVCQILSGAPGIGQMNAGTGVFIGPRTVLTAAHNLYVGDTPANRYELYLAVNGDREMPPLRSYVATQAVHHPDYNHFGNTPKSDIAIIQLDAPLPNEIVSRFGTMPVALIEPSQWDGQRGFVTGYPKDYPNFDPDRPDLFPPPDLGTQAFQYYCVSEIRCVNGLLRYNLDTSVGQSGGPLVAVGLVGGQRRSVCIGVHIQGADREADGNLANPLDSRNYQWVMDHLSGAGSFV